MADTPIFESEKLLKKQRKKRTLIIIAVCAAVLAAAAAAFIAGRCSGRTHTGGEELAFPYTWREAADGSALVTVSREGEETLSWRITDPGDNFGCVGIAPAGSGKDGSSFKLTPIKEGRSAAVIVLGSEDGSDKYRMELLTEAYADGSKLRCRLLEASCRPVQGEISAEGDVVYRVFADPDGDLVIEVESTQTDWECVSSNESAAQVIGVINTDDCVRAYLRAGGEPGVSEVTLESAADRKKLTSRFTLSADGGFICSAVETSAEPTVEPTENAGPTPTVFPTGDPLLTPTPAPTEAPAEPTANP